MNAPAQRDDQQSADAGTSGIGDTHDASKVRSRSEDPGQSSYGGFKNEGPAEPNGDATDPRRGASGPGMAGDGRDDEIVDDEEESDDAGDDADSDAASDEASDDTSDRAGDDAARNGGQATKGSPHSPELPLFGED